uniref:ribonuclease H n=1 Tax=Xenopus tropicalis TaxID=8364 RepID=A0A803JPC4_XENTR
MDQEEEPNTLALLSQQLDALTLAVQELQGGFNSFQEQLNDLQYPAAAAGPTTAPPSEPQVGLALPAGFAEPKIPLPDRFTGDRKTFRSFMNACKLLFTLKPRTYPSEQARVGTVISLLQGEPQTWAFRLMDQQDPVLSRVETFFQAMAVLYDDPHRTSSAETALRSHHQGRRPVEDYTLEFRKYAADTDWNEAALKHQFRIGLTESLKDELARTGIPESLEDFILLTIQLDRRLRERKVERQTLTAPSWVTPRAPPPVRVDPSAPSLPDPEPMQIGALRSALSSEERLRLRHLGLCLYCGLSGHLLRDCPTRPSIPGKDLKRINCRSDLCPAPLLTVSLILQWEDKSAELQAIIDSGASGCFIDAQVVKSFHIPLRLKKVPMFIRMADGSAINSGPVTQETLPLRLSLNKKHIETLCFDVVASPLFPVILGLPWLRAHNPSIDWSSGKMTFCSNYCSQNCGEKSSLHFCSLVDKSDALPEPYREFEDVFDKKGADVLPPHREYDCPIELHPGAQIPFGRIYPLAESELLELRRYLDENLAKGFIHPSTSPAGAGIFFVEKKDHSLRPCIDYRELNKITVKNRYPLPLIPELFQQIREARIFSKLDLRGAYNLVRIRKGDEWKTAFRSRYGHFEYLVMPFGLCNAPATFQHLVNDIFRDFLDIFVIIYLDDILIFSKDLEEHRKHMKKVFLRLRTHQLFVKLEKCLFEKTTIDFLGFIISPFGIRMDPKKISSILDWPAPTSRKAVQRLVGFANFYRKFIRNFSQIILPITELTRSNQKFVWTCQAQTAFEILKKLFTSAPILCHPDPSLPFTLEVDASESAVGAILSQRVGLIEELHPVAFFSRKLNKSEQNYDVADRELLAIKLALEEWRYLLEGARFPILILTDHRNLEYLRSAKRLRPRQARWALFFMRFNFHITYRPGAKNVKPDALSRMFSADADSTQRSEPILSPKHFLIIQSSLMNQLKEVSSTISDPPSTKNLSFRNGLFFHYNQVFVPPELRLEVLNSVKYCNKP